MLGMPINAAPPPNTVIELPGIGFVILNEQFCDDQGTLAHNCSDGTVLDHAGLTVRAIHLVRQTYRDHMFSWEPVAAVPLGRSH